MSPPAISGCRENWCWKLDFLQQINTSGTIRKDRRRSADGLFPEGWDQVFTKKEPEDSRPNLPTPIKL